MPPAALPQLALPFDDAPPRQGGAVAPERGGQPGLAGESFHWSLKLVDAISCKRMKSGYLPIAEEAVCENAGNPYVLILAAAAPPCRREGRSGVARIEHSEIGERRIPGRQRTGASLVSGPGVSLRSSSASVTGLGDVPL